MRRKVRDIGYSIPYGKYATAKECYKESSNYNHFWCFDCQAIGRSKELEEIAKNKRETTKKVVNNGETTKKVVIKEKTTEKVVKKETTEEIVKEIVKKIIIKEEK